MQQINFPLILMSKPSNGLFCTCALDYNNALKIIELSHFS